MEKQVYKNVLVGVDGSEQSDQAYKKALEVARRNDAHLVVVHIVEESGLSTMGYPTITENSIDQESEDSKELLRKCEKYAKDVKFSNIETILVYGSPKRSLAVELPSKYDIDVIAIGQSGINNTVERLTLGGVSSYVIRQAPCDVLIVHSDSNG